MSRVERFKEMRQTRRRYCCAAALSLILLITGVCTADYSVNHLLNNNDHVNIFKVTKIGGSRYEIGVFNYRMKLDLTYLKRDMGRIKKIFKND